MISVSISIMARNLRALFLLFQADRSMRAHGLAYRTDPARLYFKNRNKAGFKLYAAAVTQRSIPLTSVCGTETDANYPGM